MPPKEAPLDLTTLCERAGVTARTVRYYVQCGLIPSPGRRGPATPYHEGHLSRLRLIRRLQGAHLPLAEIRKRLDLLTDDQVAEALGESKGSPGTSATEERRDGALEYIQLVQAGLSGTKRPAERKAVTEPFPLERAQWERLALTEDIELHVRRPLSREQNRRLEQLIDTARQILLRG